MSEANIAIKATDQFSTKVNSMANASKGLSKAMEEAQRKAQQMSQRQDALIRSNAKLKTSLESAGKELKAAKKAFQDTGNAADAKALEEAQEKYDRLKMSIADTTQELKDCQKEMRNLEAQERRGGSGGGGGEASLSTRLGQSGLAAAIGDWAANLGGMFAQSAGGDAAASMFSSVLGGAGTGAAIGTAIAPGIGTAIGAVIGAAGGVITGIAEEAGKKDDSFRERVRELYDTTMDVWENSLTNGVQIAAQREMDVIAFDTLLGDGVGSGFLDALREKAATTPMEYDDLTGIARQLAIGFADAPDAMLKMMDVIGDAGSATGMDASGMQMVATALSRMQSSDKVTLEYLNLLQERGINAVGMIGEANGMTVAQVYDAISKGSLDGSDIVTLLVEKMGEAYAGSMGKMSQTYGGLQSTVGDIQNERDAALGRGYINEVSKGLQAEIAWDETWGEELQGAYEQIGTFYGSVENQKNELIRQAMEAVISGDTSVLDADIFGEDSIQLLSELADNYAEGAALNDGTIMGEALASAQNAAYAAYTNTEGYRIMTESQMRLIENTQAAVADSYYTFGYEMGQQFSMGYAGVTNAGALPNPGGVTLPYGAPAPGSYLATHSGAYGFDRIPYNGYYAMLHEGERVLTARQARQMDAAGSAGGVVITGNNFTVREDADVTRIASELVRQIRSAQMVYAGG